MFVFWRVNLKEGLSKLGGKNVGVVRAINVTEGNVQPQFLVVSPPALHSGQFWPNFRSDLGGNVWRIYSSSHMVQWKIGRVFQDPFDFFSIRVT